MGGIDDNQIATCRHQKFGTVEAILANCGGSSDAQAAVGVLAGVGVFLSLFDILDRDEADAAVGVVDDEQLFDPVLVKQTLGFVLGDGALDGDELVLRHQFGHGLVEIGGKAHVAVGQNADELATARTLRWIGGPDAGLNDGNAANAVGCHQGIRFA